MKPDGYRYVRRYNTRKGFRWALWERQAGRARRVGTALTWQDYYRFLRIDPTTSAAIYANEACYA